MNSALTTFAHILSAAAVAFTGLDITVAEAELLADLYAFAAPGALRIDGERAEAMATLHAAGLVVARPNAVDPYHMELARHARHDIRACLIAPRRPPAEIGAYVMAA